MASINAVTQAEIQAQTARINRILLTHEVRLRPRLQREIIRLWRRFGSLDVALIEFQENIEVILAREARRTANDIADEIDDRLTDNGSASVKTAVLGGIAAFLLSRSQEAAREITQTELTNINARARALAIEGLSLREISADLRAFAPSYSINRIELIAETETARVADEVVDRSLAESGLTFVAKSWITAGDNRVRTSHSEAGRTQKRIPVDEPFQVGSSQMMRPRDRSLGAPGEEIYRCRCDVAYFTE